jgi:hypothetical protein
MGREIWRCAKGRRRRQREGGVLEEGGIEG